MAMMFSMFIYYIIANVLNINFNYVCMYVYTYVVANDIYKFIMFIQLVVQIRSALNQVNIVNCTFGQLPE